MFAESGLPVEGPPGDDLSRAVDGDRAAFVSLLKRHGPVARRAVRGRIPPRWQSVLSEEDVLQQTYADAFVHIRQLTAQHESSFAKWLETIACHNLNEVLKLLAAAKRGGLRKRVDPAANDESFIALHEWLAATSTTPSRHAARGEAKAALERAIGQLPEDYQRVVWMYDLEGRTVEQVAEALQRSPGAVFMLRARAHERLRELMGHTSEFLSG